MKKSRGVTLVELLVATAVLTVGILGLIGGMGGIQKAIQGARTKTLASNLTQEQMQIIKQKTYYQVLVTTDPSYRTDYSPSIPYDNGYFPPENILEGGINFQRLTYIQVCDEDSGKIVTLPPSSPDTGMRLLTVTVLWTQGSEKKQLQLQSVLANPNVVMANATFSGTVRNASTLAAINGSLVSVTEDAGYRDTTNASGAYSISLSPGSYTMQASAPGYFSQIVSVSITANQSLTQNFDLVPMSSGSVVGVAWMNPNILISQVVVATTQASGFVAQYVELFNPTTSAITIGGDPPPIKLNFQSTCQNANKVTCTDSTYGIKLNYVSSTTAAGGYYLIANTNTFTAAGQQVNADAYYTDDANTYCNPQPSGYSPNTYDWNLTASPPVKLLGNPASSGHNGTFWLTDASGNILDAVGWTHSGSPPNCEGTCLTLPGGNGLQEQNQLERFSSTAGVSGVWGPAYDSDNNSVDFSTFAAITVAPSSSTMPTKSLIAGRVAVGAIASSIDGLSDPVSVVSVGSPPYAAFSLTQVATGTWTVFVSSGGYTLQHDTVTIAGTGSVFTFPSTMTFLNQSNEYGFISGMVTDALGAPIPSPGIVLSPGAAGSNTTASLSNGRYLLRVSPGLADVTANPNNANPLYVSQSSNSLTINLGEVYSNVNFPLSQGGRVQGFVTRDGVNALPGVAVAALDANGEAHNQQVSGSDGRFTMINLTTGVYTLQPALDSLETSSPSSATVTVLAGQTVFGATFTITGALGSITGSVSLSAQPLRTGVLIVATTATITGAPPALSTATLASAPRYVTSSKEDGTFQVDVRQSTDPAYKVYAYYTTLTSTGGVVIQSASTSGVQVLSGQTVSGINFAW